MSRIHVFGLLLVAVGACSAPVIRFDGSAFPDPSGEVRALVLWVRFADDDTAHRAAVTRAGRGWAEPDRLPPLADSVLSRSPRRPMGLTRYFLDQSRGAFRLTGSSFPEVMVTREPERTYVRRDGTLDQSRLTEELVRAVDADSRLELEDFDADRDGYVDYLFIVVRSMKEARLYRSHASGVSDLGYTSPDAEFGKRSTLRIDRNASGSYIRYDDAGNIFPEMDLVRLMAHEIGHDLWREFVHLRPVADAPRGRTVGYALMAGDFDARGDETISAYERDLRNWIECKALRSDTVFVVRDLYTSEDDNCFTLDVGNAGRIYVSHRQRLGPFDRILHEDARQARSDQGLMDTGVLMMRTQPHGRVAPIPADGSLTLSVHAADYAGDLFNVGDSLTASSVPPLPGAAPGQGLFVMDRIGADGMRVRYAAGRQSP